MASKKKPLKKKATPPYKSKERSKGKSYSKVLPPKKKAASTKLKKSSKVVYSKKKAPPKKVVKKAQLKKVVKKAQLKKVVKKAQPKKASPKKVVKKTQPKKAVKKIQPKKVVKKAQLKKVVKKAQLKKVVKKAQPKKASPKKVVKKTQPKKVVKKIQPKKVVKKASPKKVVKKSAPKKPTPTAYKLITLDAKTGKKVKAKPRQHIFFAWESSSGTITRLKMEYSQPYYKSDADGILKGFKAGSPSAFVLYKQLTKTQAFHYDKKGKKVADVRFDKKGKLVTKTTKDGKEVPVKVYRWKLTGRKLKEKQSPAIYNTKDFIAPLSVGFHPHEAKEIPKGGFIKVKVEETTKRRKGMPVGIKPTVIGPFIGDSIRETIEHIIPSMGIKEQIRKKVKSLIVSGFVMVYKPENPYKSGTDEFKAREQWSEAVWKGADFRRFNVGVNVDRLVNFATVLASAIRVSMSSEGVRVSSALHLRNAEEFQRKRDETIFQPLGFPPAWPLIINEPPNGVRDVNGKFMHATDYLPLRYEGDGEWPVHKDKSKYATKIILHLGIRALK